MGRFNLQVKATLENVAAITKPAEADWHFKVKCSVCHLVNENIIYFNLVDKIQASGVQSGKSFF